MDEKELRKIISEVLHENPRVMYIPDLAPYLLEKIDKVGYRKIPEGDVVISKKEYDNLFDFNLWLLSKVDYVYQVSQKGVDSARQKTATEILQRLCALMLTESHTYKKLDGNMVDCIEADKVMGDMDEIAKEYGVEVEE